MLTAKGLVAASSHAGVPWRAGRVGPLWPMRRQSSSTVVYIGAGIIDESTSELQSASARSRSSSIPDLTFHAAEQLIRRRWRESQLRTARALIARQEGARDEKVCGMWPVRRPAGQRRALLLTTEALYHTSTGYGSCKRRTPLGTIRAITTSSTSGQFVLHIADSYDALYIKRRGKQELIDTIVRTAAAAAAGAVDSGERPERVDVTVVTDGDLSQRHVRSGTWLAQASNAAHDHLGLLGSAWLLRLLKQWSAGTNETVQLTAAGYVVSSRGVLTPRKLLLTQQALYLLSGTTCQRRIALKRVGMASLALSKSMAEENVLDTAAAVAGAPASAPSAAAEASSSVSSVLVASDNAHRVAAAQQAQFALHVVGEHDCVLICEQRNRLLEQLSRHWAESHAGAPLMVALIRQPDVHRMLQSRAHKRRKQETASRARRQSALLPRAARVFHRHADNSADDFAELSMGAPTRPTNGSTASASSSAAAAGGEANTAVLSSLSRLSRAATTALSVSGVNLTRFSLNGGTNGSPSGNGSGSGSGSGGGSPAPPFSPEGGAWRILCSDMQGLSGSLQLLPQERRLSFTSAFHERSLSFHLRHLASVSLVNDPPSSARRRKDASGGGGGAGAGAGGSGGHHGHGDAAAAATTAWLSLCMRDGVGHRFRVLSQPQRGASTGNGNGNGRRTPTPPPASSGKMPAVPRLPPPQHQQQQQQQQQQQGGGNGSNGSSGGSGSGRGGEASLAVEQLLGVLASLDELHVLWAEPAPSWVPPELGDNVRFVHQSAPRLWVAGGGADRGSESSGCGTAASAAAASAAARTAAKTATAAAAAHGVLPPRDAHMELGLSEAQPELLPDQLQVRLLALEHALSAAASDRARWGSSAVQARVTRTCALLWPSVLLPFGMLLSRRRAFAEIAPLVPMAWRLLAQLPPSRQRQLARARTSEALYALDAAGQLAVGAPFVASPLVRWVASQSEVRELTAEIDAQLAAATTARAEMAMAGADNDALEVGATLCTVLQFLADEVRAWPRVEAAPATAAAKTAAAGAAAAGPAAATEVSKASDGDGDGGGGGGGGGDDALLQGVLRRIGTEAGRMPRLERLRPSEKEGVVLLDQTPLWGVLHGGLLGLFAPGADGGAPTDPAATCLHRLDLRLAVVELHPATAASSSSSSPPKPTPESVLQAWRAVCRVTGRSLQVHASHRLVNLAVRTLGEAFAWQAALARSASTYCAEHGLQHALAMLLPVSPKVARLVARTVTYPALSASSVSAAAAAAVTAAAASSASAAARASSSYALLPPPAAERSFRLRAESSPEVGRPPPPHPTRPTASASDADIADTAADTDAADTDAADADADAAADAAHADADGSSPPRDLPAKLLPLAEALIEQLSQDQPRLSSPEVMDALRSWASRRFKPRRQSALSGSI